MSDYNTEADNTPFGAFGEFEPVTDPDFDWDEYYTNLDNEMARYDAERADWEYEAYAAQWDDDPSPYDGNYSEM